MIRTSIRALFLCSAMFCSLMMKDGLLSFDFNYRDVPELKKVGWADETGLVRRTFKITVPEIKYPYNPSIIRYEKNYLLSFRYDPKYNEKGVHPGVVGLLRLNANFRPIYSSTLLPLGNGSAEDGRIFIANDNLYVVYTHVTQAAPQLCNMAIAELDPFTFDVLKDMPLAYGTNREKNWSPFVYHNLNTRQDDVFFVYSFCPQEILKLGFPVKGNVTKVYVSRARSKLKEWEKKLGSIRGGTPPIKVGNEYLTFFHSSFISNKIRYYVMGALTFNDQPPFKITRMSTKPILFKRIYETPVTPNVHFYPRKDLRVLFPSGCVEGNEDGSDVFYVVCGENDVAIKCVVVDKEKLYQSLEPINSVR